jgi:hypothetical protein
MVLAYRLGGLAMRNLFRISATTTAFTFASGLALVVGFASSATAAQSTPTSMTISPGTYAGTVGNLALANDGKIVNLYTNRKGNLAATFQFSASGLSTSLMLNASFLQLTGSDIFSFQVKNSSGAYINLGSTSGSASTYKALSFPLPSTAVVNGGITVRLISNAGSSDCNLDFLAITDSGVSPAPSTMPTISSFKASSINIIAGQISTLSWAVSNATSLQLNPGSFNVTGISSLAVSPSANTTYTLTAVNSAGSVTQSLSINISASTIAGITVPAGTKWNLQLQGTVNTKVVAKLYDIDMFDNSSALFASLKQSGHTVICYFSAGTYENWRSDANQFPTSAIGNKVSGWAGENWLDVRDTTVRQIMTNRMDLAKSKGCDGIDPDNVDGYSNNSGFPLTMQDQINFNTFLADQAHARGMVIALKNSTNLVTALVNKFDFAVVEQCFDYNECSAYSPFINQNKAVLEAEYISYSSSICSQAASLNFSTVFYNLNLDGTVYNPCP